MKTIKLLSYYLLSWLGRRIYSLRIRLENLNDKVDLLAGQHDFEDGS